MNRRPYLDWLRGIAVLIMIEAHTLDSWTRAADRSQSVYKWAIVVAGFGAPIFLFLAGVALSLAAGARLRKGAAPREVAHAALKRGAWILILAFLFRLQSFVISGGTVASLLKVDILNVMGLAMMIAAVLWGSATNSRGRALLFTAVTILLAMLTPIVRDAPSLAVLPDAFESYLRPAAGLTTFTLFPWAGFLTAGSAVGVLLNEAQQPAQERRLNLGLAAVGALVGFAGYAASYLPAIYAHTNFWTSSPTFFFVRLGILIAALPVAYGLGAVWRGAPLQEFGRASLFIYWIHVEMVYGVLSLPLHRQLPFPVAVAAFAAFSLLMFGAVRLRDNLMPPPGRAETRISGKSPTIPAQVR